MADVLFNIFQGTGPSVPKYLQHDGPVRNRRLGKRDASLLIKDIWREKGAHDAAVSLMLLFFNLMCVCLFEEKKINTGIIPVTAFSFFSSLCSRLKVFSM